MSRDHWQHRDRGSLAALAAALVVFGLPAATAAQSAPSAVAGGEQALVSVYSGGVDFLPEVDFKKAVLTVSGAGEVHRHELAPGQRISIGMFDPDGEPLPDGTYRWELQFVPTEGIAAWLRAEAAKNPGQRLDAWLAQSGTFTIRDGFVADPDLAEPQAVRARSATASPALAASSPSEAARSAAIDFDGAAPGSERQAAARAAATAAPILAAPDRVAFERSDGAALAAGGSLESAPAPASKEQPSQFLAGPPARSASENRANGRDRSAQDQ